MHFPGDPDIKKIRGLLLLRGIHVPGQREKGGMFFQFVEAGVRDTSDWDVLLLVDRF